MEALTRPQQGRRAIRTFQIMADALLYRGFYKPSGRSGRTLEEALRVLSPEIYGSMNDPNVVELEGLVYVLDRLPRGIEECSRFTLTAREEFDLTSFERIVPPRRRRVSYRVSDQEMCFIITSGQSEIYDILAHVTFLNIEAHKISRRIRDDAGQVLAEWTKLERMTSDNADPAEEGSDRALWNLSKVVGRSYQETRRAFEQLESSRKVGASRGLFHVVHSLGRRSLSEEASDENELLVTFTPALQAALSHHLHGRHWAETVKRVLGEMGMIDRPLHIISANMHSVVNTLYGFAASGAPDQRDLYELAGELRPRQSEVKTFAGEHGFREVADTTGANIDFQVVDAVKLLGVACHPAVRIDRAAVERSRPVILVMDYAFGIQAFEVMDELLKPIPVDGKPMNLRVESISIMGKAGILVGKKGDIMLATAHVLEGTPHNYLFQNDLTADDFGPSPAVFEGPIVTVLGTSLQNRDVLEQFRSSSWKAVGLEMEGGHYQRAINAAIIRKHISKDVKVRYAYYASDNPLLSSQTLASGGMGDEGIPPTYAITRVVLGKILGS